MKHFFYFLIAYNTFSKQTELSGPLQVVFTWSTVTMGPVKVTHFKRSRYLVDFVLDIIIIKKNAFLLYHMQPLV